MKVSAFVVINLSFPLVYAAATPAVPIPSASAPSPCDEACVSQRLGPKLSKGASIISSLAPAPRWSDFHSPWPGTVVNVATEQDVLTTVTALLRRLVDVFLQSIRNTDAAQRSNSATFTIFDSLPKMVATDGRRPSTLGKRT